MRRLLEDSEFGMVGGGEPCGVGLRPFGELLVGQAHGAGSDEGRDEAGADQTARRLEGAQ